MRRVGGGRVESKSETRHEQGQTIMRSIKGDYLRLQQLVTRVFIQVQGVVRIGMI